MILPRRNEKSFNEDLPAEVRQAMTVHLVDGIGEVLDLALEEGVLPRLAVV